MFTIHLEVKNEWRDGQFYVYLLRFYLPGIRTVNCK